MLEDVFLPISKNSDFSIKNIWDFNLSRNDDQREILNSSHDDSNKTVIVQLFNEIYVFQSLSLIKYYNNNQN